jgi:hypothetical protein
MYVAVRMRRQSLTEQFAVLPEEQKCVLLYTEVAIDNEQLDEAIRAARVIMSADLIHYS